MSNINLYFRSLVVVYATPGNSEFSVYKFPLSLSSEESRAQPHWHPQLQPTANLEFNVKIKKLIPSNTLKLSPILCFKKRVLKTNISTRAKSNV